MRGRRGNKPIFVKKLTEPSIIPALCEHVFAAGEKKSKNIKIFFFGDEEYRIGYYDHILCSYITYSGTDHNPKAKRKIDQSDIKGWAYL